MPQKTLDIVVDKKKITLQTGILAPQANAAVLVSSGKNVILATVTMGPEDQTKDYFPLSVEFSDKLYAGGLIKGSKWLKREGGLNDQSILLARLIDRSIRPLFPKGFRNEVQVIVTVLSNDKQNDLVIPAFTAVSTALAISDIPFAAPVSAVRVGLLDNKLLLNPDLEQLSNSALDLIVCTNSSGVNMIEASANIVDNKTVLEAITLAQKTSQSVNKQTTDFVKKNGKKKIEFQPFLPDQKLIDEIDAFIKKDIESFLINGADDGQHMAAEQLIIDKVLEKYQKEIEAEELDQALVIEAVHAVIKKYFRANVLRGTRFDKRKLDQVRPLTIQASVLPCTHGSAFFQRGLTQALTITTLSGIFDQQYLQNSTGESTKRFLHFYSSMPFSTGQTGRIGRPGRREVGHGALAEKALLPIIPDTDTFPYTILVNSEILSQNGSSSMASTCGSTMSLMDAGVPIKDLVAGISIGMVSDDQNNYKLLTDIAGIEDHHGDMDFKITGTKTGITAIQLDIKTIGLTMDMIKATFEASTKARLDILAAMQKTLKQPRPQLSAYAPKIRLVTIPEDKIGDVVGSGGRTIKALMKKYTVQIDIEDDGQTSVMATQKDSVDKAVFAIESMVRDIEVGEEFDGTVTRIEDYGAFVEFLPGREALVHVSELAQGFISNPRTIIKLNDKIHVKVIGFNENHQIKLSAPAFKAAHPGQDQPRRHPARPATARGPQRPTNRASFSRFNSSLGRRPPRRQPHR